MINKLWYIHTLGYMHEPELNISTQVDLENIMSSAKRKLQKMKLYLWIFKGQNKVMHGYIAV